MRPLLALGLIALLGGCQPSRGVIHHVSVDQHYSYSTWAGSDLYRSSPLGKYHLDRYHR